MASFCNIRKHIYKKEKNNKMSSPACSPVCSSASTVPGAPKKTNRRVVRVNRDPNGLPSADLYMGMLLRDAIQRDDLAGVEALLNDGAIATAGHILQTSADNIPMLRALGCEDVDVQE